jgi:hypothetical protein
MPDHNPKREFQMTKNLFSILSMLIITLLLTGIPSLYAQTSPSDFPSEPDKTMAAAQESFVKKDTKKASEQIGKAAAYVNKEADKVAKDAKEGVKKAGDGLTKLGGILGTPLFLCVSPVKKNATD